MSKVKVNTDSMTGDGNGYIPLSTGAIELIFDYWGDCVEANGSLSKSMDYYDENLRDDLYGAVNGERVIYLTKALHWDQFGYHFTGTIGKSTETLHFYVEIDIGRSHNERWHVGSDFQVKNTTTRWRIVTIANTFGYGGNTDTFRNRPPFPMHNSRELAQHMPPWEQTKVPTGKWQHDKFNST